MTRQKSLILQIIRESNRHLTADEIYHTAKDRLPKIAVGTVYRNLGKLTEDGMIQKISIPGQPDHYDRTMEEHAHLICTACGQIEDAHMQGLREFLESQSNSPIQSYDLTIHHLCEHCKNPILV